MKNTLKTIEISEFNEKGAKKGPKKVFQPNQFSGLSGRIQSTRKIHLGSKQSTKTNDKHKSDLISIKKLKEATKLDENLNSRSKS